MGAVLSGLPPAPVDLVVLDPPREGARRTVVEAVVAREPRAVAYVACDPAALARDVARLLQREQAPRSYRVQWAAAEQRIEWVQTQPGGELVHTSEPGATWNSNLTARTMALVVNEEML